MSTKPPPREQEQTIRTRKQFLFDAEEAQSGDGKPSKSFAEYVRVTPAAPLNPMIKAALWAAGAIVVLLLILTIMKTSGSGKPKPPAPQTSSLSQPSHS